MLLDKSTRVMCIYNMELNEWIVLEIRAESSLVMNEFLQMDGKLFWNQKRRKVSVQPPYDQTWSTWKITYYSNDLNIRLLVI